MRSCLEATQKKLEFIENMVGEMGSISQTMQSFGYTRRVSPRDRSLPHSLCEPLMTRDYPVATALQ